MNPVTICYRGTYDRVRVGRVPDNTPGVQCGGGGGGGGGQQLAAGIWDVIDQNLPHNVTAEMFANEVLNLLQGNI